MADQDNQNPFAAPQVVDTGLPQVNTNATGSLGNLAQSAQQNNLRSAQIIMILIGVVMVGFHAYEFINAREMLVKEVRKNNPGYVQLNQAVIDEYTTYVRIIDSVVIAIGISFLLMAAFIYSYPVQFTITALVLYILFQLASAIIDPSAIHQGIILKVLIVVGLWKAIQSAYAYDAERRLQRFA